MFVTFLLGCLAVSSVCLALILHDVGTLRNRRKHKQVRPTALQLTLVELDALLGTHTEPSTGALSIADRGNLSEVGS